MTLKEIIEAFETAEGFPREAIAAAEARREELVPQFLAHIDEFLASDEEVEVPTAMFALFHLLGSWRETGAYRHLARLLAMDPDRLEWQFGEAVPANAHRVMYNVFDGDPQPLYDLVENERADEQVRSAMLQTLAMLVRAEKLPREPFVAYLRAAPDRLKPQDDSLLWHGFRAAATAVAPQELAPLVRDLYARGWINPDLVPVEEFEEDLERLAADPEDRFFIEMEHLTPFGDLEEELGSWAWGTELPAGMEDIDLDDPGAVERYLAGLADRDPAPQEPVHNPYRHVGRNDPCPCGSGRKFKKCCGK